MKRIVFSFVDNFQIYYVSGNGDVFIQNIEIYEDGVIHSYRKVNDYSVKFGVQSIEITNKHTEESICFIGY